MQDKSANDQIDLEPMTPRELSMYGYGERSGRGRVLEDLLEILEIDKRIAKAIEEHERNRHD
jgi:hypothetical protein